MSLPFVSVIIPVYNGAASIRQAVQAVFAQEYPGGMELVVADDGSTDGTAACLSGFPVVYVQQSNAGPASARNLGAAKAKGDILVFTDADCRPEPGWLKRLIAGFTLDDIAAVAGSYAIANPEYPLARVIHDEILYRHRCLMPDFPRAFGSYNVAIRRSVFEGLGGFDTFYRNASGEDNDLSYKVIRQGGKIRFDREARVAHYHQHRFLPYLKEQLRHGFWRVKMYGDHPVMAAGDGYTFWKDMIEPVLVILLAGVLLAGRVEWFAAGAGLFFLFEIFWGFLMMRAVRDVFFSGAVFFFRSFARTAGFLLGGAAAFLAACNKDKKKTKNACGSMTLC